MTPNSPNTNSNTGTVWLQTGPYLTRSGDTRRHKGIYKPHLQMDTRRARWKEAPYPLGQWHFLFQVPTYTVIKVTPIPDRQACYKLPEPVRLYVRHFHPTAVAAADRHSGKIPTSSLLIAIHPTAETRGSGSMLDAFLPSFPSKYIRDNIRYLGVQISLFLI